MSKKVFDPSYYHFMGVSTDATHDELRKAYRDCARRMHPDAGGPPGQFEELNSIYQVLSDPELREQYDKYGSAEKAAEVADTRGMQIIAELIQNILSAEDKVLERIDVVEELRAAVGRALAQIGVTRGKIEHERKKLLKLLKRLKRKDGKNRSADSTDFLGGFIRSRSNVMEKALADLEEETEEAQCALEILDTYKYEVNMEAILEMSKTAAFRGSDTLAGKSFTVTSMEEPEPKKESGSEG